jgi:hypothetical protein
MQRNWGCPQKRSTNYHTKRTQLFHDFSSPTLFIITRRPLFRDGDSAALSLGIDVKNRNAVSR